MLLCIVGYIRVYIEIFLDASIVSTATRRMDRIIYLKREKRCHCCFIFIYILLI